MFATWRPKLSPQRRAGTAPLGEAIKRGENGDVVEGGGASGDIAGEGGGITGHSEAVVSPGELKLSLSSQMRSDEPMPRVIEVVRGASYGATALAAAVSFDELRADLAQEADGAEEEPLAVADMPVVTDRTLQRMTTAEQIAMVVAATAGHTANRSSATKVK